MRYFCARLPYTIFLFRPFLFLFLCPVARLGAQCNAPISVFPYHEDFEVSAGGWSSGGTNDDWTLGTPSKPVINVAGSGTRCWVTGGLSGSFYNLGERSFVESPCFDFSALPYPYIRFKIWWESEYIYDGSNLQYSVDDGSSWNNVGRSDDPVSCLNENWYNTAVINNLSGLANPRQGWSGNMNPTMGSCQGGNGSNGWVTAKHCMGELGGKPKVRFRFVFGTGTTCNDFDGIAFDDLYIENAPAVVADFSSICAGNYSYSFTDLSANCPDTWTWDFGDPASGATNLSTLQNPLHKFSAPGIYTITLKVSNGCSAGDSISMPVEVKGLLASATPASCFGAQDGSASVQLDPPGGNPSYVWNTTPTQFGANAQQLAAGDYTVSVSGIGNCLLTAIVNVAQPSDLQYSLLTSPSYCGNPNGSATLIPSGGTGPYVFQWMPNVSPTGLAEDLVSGNYLVLVEDQHHCVDTAFVTIDQLDSIPLGLPLVSPVKCFGGQEGSISVSAGGGTPPFSYAWSNGGSNGPSLTNLPAGLYTVTVSDVFQCSATAHVALSQPDSLHNDLEIKGLKCEPADAAVSILSSGGSPPYAYTWFPGGSLGFNASGLKAGLYEVVVADALDCRDTLQFELEAPVQLDVKAFTDTTVTPGSPVSLSAELSDPDLAKTFRWEPGIYLDCDTCRFTLATPLQTTIYTLFVEDSNGCLHSDAVEIRVLPGAVYLPNVLHSPSESLNDFFTVFGGPDLELVEILRIYDRWGSLVFENRDFNPSDPASGWDGSIRGEPGPPGVYLYTIRIRYLNGEKVWLNGDLTVLR